MESESNAVSAGSDSEVIKQSVQKMDQQTVPENGTVNGTSDNVTEPEVKSAEDHDPNLTNGETVLHNGEKESENKSMEDESKKLNETETENTINDSEKQKDLVTEINEVIVEKSSEEEIQKQDQDIKEQTAASDEAKTENEKSSEQEEEKSLSMDQSESECLVANATEAETVQEKPVEEIVKESPETENSGNANNKEVQANEGDKKETLESNTPVAAAATEDSKQEETDKEDKSDVMEDRTDEKSIVIEEKKENSIVIIEKEEQITEKSENTELKKQSESVEETEKVKADSNTPSASKTVSFKDEKVNGNIKEDDKPKDNIQANFGGISLSVREIQVNIAPGKPVSPNNIFSKAKTKFVVSNSNNTMSTPDLAFRNIQRNKAGFYIWRIENMKVVAVPKDQYGNFFKGDSYIILSMSEPGGKMGIGVKIKDVKGSMEMHIHFWLGSETSQDEAGAAAYKTVELDDFLGGAPVQHRETEGHESKTFLNYFKEGSSGVKYLKGGVKSGFNHVDIKYTEHLWKVKGRHHVRVTEEDIGWSSMNDGDVFVLEVPKCGTIFVWNGQNSSRQEKIKGIKYANQLRDMLSKVYHNVVVMESGRESSELESSELKVFEEYLPLNKKSEMQTIEQAGSDAAADKESSVVKLYLCKEEDNKLTMSEVKTGPLKYADLDPHDAFIVDAGASGVWFWKGKEASEKERKEGMKRAMGFVQKKGMGRNTQVSTVVQGAEPPEFQCLFADWPVPKSTGKVYNRNKIARTIQTKFDASSLHSNPKLAAETQMVDDGSGRVEVWRVEGNELKAVDLKYFGEFFAGDCYVIQYTYDSKGSKAHIIYFWLGQNASDNEKGSAALHAVNLDDKLGGVATQIRVVQGKEPDHFLAMFDGKMIIFDEGEKSEVGVHGQRKDRYMLQVRGTSTLCTKSVEVPFSAESLNSNDVFLVITKSSVHIWNGKGCTGDEREMAKKISTKYNRTPEMVFEGQEKAEFWKLLGGKKEYASVERLKKSEEVREPRLFEITNATGRLTAEEIPNFTQSDLDEDDVMLLDAWDCLILWIGQGSNKAEREGAPKLAQEYLNSDPAGRDPDTPILVVKQGFEPPNFTGFFGVWDRDLWSSGKSYEQLKQEAKENNVAITTTYNGTANGDSDFGTVLKYSLEELQVPAEELPSGVDPTCRELHLEMPEFQQLFGMDYTSFQALPAWKQANLKKKHKLF